MSTTYFDNKGRAPLDPDTTYSRKPLADCHACVHNEGAKCGLLRSFCSPCFVRALELKHREEGLS